MGKCLKSNMTITITGASGFIGSYLTNLFKDKYKIFTLSREELYLDFKINSDIVIHLAGIAHDIREKQNSNMYYQVNNSLTRSVYNKFLISNATIFINLSSIKAVIDSFDVEITEELTPSPTSDYGRSKLMSDEYILKSQLPLGKKFFILRPCMVHGPGNRGNLNLLHKIVKKGIPWPLGAFENKRSFCSIDNLCFIINELIENNQISSGIYNIADDKPLSTNEVIELISHCQGRNIHIWDIPIFIIKALSKLGDILGLPLNSSRLKKLTENYIVSNKKIKQAINKPLPISSKDGLIKTFNSFNRLNR